MPSKIAGMFAFSGEFGGVVAVNAKHPAVRRRATMLHEYGHLITDRYKPGVDYLGYPGVRKPPNERFAEAFSMAFLMPATSVRRRFNQVVNDSGDFQISDLCRMKHSYFVSLEAMTIRLENLGLIPKGVLQHLKESRFEVRKAGELLGLDENRGVCGRFSDRYISLAVHAFDRGELSEGQLAAFLRCDRVAAREVVEKFLTSTDLSEDGGWKPPILARTCSPKHSGQSKRSLASARGNRQITFNGGWRSQTDSASPASCILTSQQLML
jgi:Zn-dependent peptidase ImmA (M78 family)